MKNFKVLFLILAIVMFAHEELPAQVDGGGTAGAFLQVAWSPRVAALGGAYVAIADDAEGGLLNPAGGIQLQKRHVTAAYRQMDLDRKMSFVSYLQGVKGDAGIGVSWINVGVSQIPERDINGELTGDIRYYENLIALTFGKRIGKEVLLGVNVKYDQSNLANISSNGLGFDLGFLWGEKKPYRIGAVVQNIGLTHKWSTGDYWKLRGLLGSSTTDEFPLTFKVGGSYQLYEKRVLVALDAEKKERQQVLIHAGAEGWIRENFALRAGFNRETITLGAGFKYKLPKSTLAFNYAFLPGANDVGLENLFSLALEF